MEQIFESPAHPYTRGLLSSIPDAAPDPDAALLGIPGQPPDMRAVPEGCPFRARCEYAFDKCVHRPPLDVLAPDHSAACWLGGEVDHAERTGRGAA